jgi:hypothetical protein
MPLKISNRFYISHSWIVAIDVRGERKEKEEKCELKGKDWRNWGNLNWENPLSR